MVELFGYVEAIDKQGSTTLTSSVVIIKVDIKALGISCESVKILLITSRT